MMPPVRRLFMEDQGTIKAAPLALRTSDELTSSRGECLGASKLVAPATRRRRSVGSSSPQCIFGEFATEWAGYQQKTAAICTTERPPTGSTNSFSLSSPRPFISRRPSLGSQNSPQGGTPNNLSPAAAKSTFSLLNLNLMSLKA